MKKLIIFAIALILCISFYSISFAQDIRIRPIDAPWKVEVRAHSKQKLWVGVTAIIEGKERDFGVKRIGGKLRSNSFTKLYEINAIDVLGKTLFSGDIDLEDPDVEWVACLWEEKVNCDSGSKWCYQNGYEMRGRVTCDRY